MDGRLSNCSRMARLTLNDGWSQLWTQLQVERALMGDARWRRMLTLEHGVRLDRWVGEIAPKGASLTRKRRLVRRALLRELAVRSYAAFEAKDREMREHEDGNNIDIAWRWLRRHQLAGFAWPSPSASIRPRTQARDPGPEVVGGLGSELSESAR